MSKFIHSVLVPNQLFAADGDQSFDLPVNPLSAILLHITPLNNDAALANYQWLEGLLSAIDNIRVSYLGSALLDLRGADAAAMALLYHGFGLVQSNAVSTDNDRRSLILPLSFGRVAYDMEECVPETRRGELTLTLTLDIADTGFDGLRISVETIELPDAKPRYFEKKITIPRTFLATGQNEIDLPIGNVVRSVLAFGTTSFAGAAPAPSLGQMQLLLNNQQTHYSVSDFEVSRGVMGLLGRYHPMDFGHRHSFLDGAGPALETFTRPAESTQSLEDNYVLLDLDPTGDDVFSIDTAGAGRFHLRVDAETADAVRVCPVERVDVSRLKART